MYTETEYTRAMKVINNWRRLIRKQDICTARPGEMWLVVWGIAWRQMWALRATWTGQLFLYTGLWKLDNSHVLCNSPLHPPAASSKVLRQTERQTVRSKLNCAVSTTFVSVGGNGRPHEIASDSQRKLRTLFGTVYEEKPANYTW